MIEDVQWHNGGGSGVRSWALYGITKVHRREQGAYQTLCGRMVPSKSRQFSRPDDKDRGRCVSCDRKAAAA